MRKGPTSIPFVYLIRNRVTNEVLRGARNNNSSFFATELSASKKCKMINDKLRQYPSCKEEDLYKVTKYSLEKVNDIF